MKRSLLLRAVFLATTFILKVRYRTKIVGIDKITKERLNPSRGILFLPNHPTIFVDPVLTANAIYKKFPVRPMVTDYVYDNPYFHWAMVRLNAFRVHNLEESYSRHHIREIEEQLDEIAEGIKRGENFLIYPAGHCKDENRELLGGSSGTYRIVQACPDVNIVLVRLKGLFGSSFSRYWQGVTPNVGPLIKRGFKEVMKNFLLFTPKREVTIEFELAPKDFFSKAKSRLEFNKTLEEWYNLPDGLSQQEGSHPGDSTVLLSYSAFGDVFPERCVKPKNEPPIDLSKVPFDLREKVSSKIAQLSAIHPEKLTPEMSLVHDLCLDSLEIAALALYMEEQFDVNISSISELTTVGKAISMAAKQSP